jgi:hypothetical protein
VASFHTVKHDLLLINPSLSNSKPSSSMPWRNSR